MAAPGSPSPLPALPIDEVLGDVVSALRRASAVVLQATPGSGKTTRVPPAILKSGMIGASQSVVVLEPRRLAAKFAARRVAEELGVRVGEEVGYQFRFENQSSARTRILFLTEGMLMRRMLSDPELRGVGAVILDEFHERHLHGDVALAFLRHLQRGARPDLKIAVMSATLDSAAVSAYLGDCPVVNLETPIFPVDIRYAKAALARHLEIEVKQAVGDLLETAGEAAGDVLVFLPGMAEIRRAGETLGSIAGSRGFQIFPLHGELSREEQDRAVGKQSVRKVILATNVAETSLTIPGVRSVIDSGLARQASYSWWSGVPVLKTRPVSKASAIQRTGRAARTGPGICVRLYTRGDYEGRAPFENPEIRRADLAQTALELKNLGVTDLARFAWFESPAETALRASEELLLRLGALGSDGRITASGRAMTAFPAHPRIARMLIESAHHGCVADASVLAALLSEGELESPDASRDLARGARDPGLKRIGSRFESLARELPALRARAGELPAPKIADREKALAFSVLSGFPDRVAWRKSPHAPEAMLSSGGSARLTENALYPSGQFWVALDVQERQGHGQARTSAFLRSALGIEEGWLFDLEQTALREEKLLSWDAARKRVVALSRLSYGELILSESSEGVDGADPAELTRVLAKGALGLNLSAGDAIPPAELVQAATRLSAEKGEALATLLARLELGQTTVPELGLPALDGRGLFRILQSVLTGRSSAQELYSIDWEQEILLAVQSDSPNFSPHLLDKWMPNHYPLHGGRRAKIHYPTGQPPWLESRLQDFFGMKEGPTVAGGRIALTLHLLAPNQRALQVTRDLAGFWARTYREVRSELMRRYPRHAWPEDPLTAQPSLPTRTARKS